MSQVTAALGLGPDQIESVLTAASLAPSVHNTQPWRFLVRRDRIELHADPARRLAATDPEDRELRLSCGAALFNLRLALELQGVRPLVSMMPGRDAPGALAVVRRGGSIRINAENRALLDAVPHRRTKRRICSQAGDNCEPSVHRAATQTQLRPRRRPVPATYTVGCRPSPAIKGSAGLR